MCCRRKQTPKTAPFHPNTVSNPEEDNNPKQGVDEFFILLFFFPENVIKIRKWAERELCALHQLHKSSNKLDTFFL